MTHKRAVPRDPLTVPVAEATPEELAVQANHHATEAAYNALSELREHHDYLEAAGLGEQLELERQQGGRLVASKRPYQVFYLRTLKDGRQFVLFLEQGRKKANFGIIKPNDETVLYQLYSDQFRWQLGDGEVRALARELGDVKLKVELAEAQRQVGARPLQLVHS